MAKTKQRARDLYAELEALPANMVGEIIAGALYAHPRPARKHGTAATDLTVELSNPFDVEPAARAAGALLSHKNLTLGTMWSSQTFPDGR